MLVKSICLIKRPLISWISAIFKSILFVFFSVNIPFEELLEKPNRKILDQTKGEIVLYSKDVSTTSKAWVILNQLGFQDVLILRNSENTEVFNYKFQPDTTARLE